MSHTKNVEAFEKLLGICAGYGSKYNPAQEKLRIEKMNALLAEGRGTLQHWSTAQADYNNASNAREVAYGSVGKLAVRMVGELEASAALKQTISDAKSTMRILKGYRSNNRPPQAAEVTTTGLPMRKRIARGTDFGSVAQHFQLLVNTVAAEPLYQPEATDLTVNALDGKVQELRTNNSKLIQAWSALNEARKKRNEVLYQEKTGLVSIAKATKKKVKAIFGATSKEYQEVAHIRFTIK